MHWYTGVNVVLKSVKSAAKVSLLGYNGMVTMSSGAGGLAIMFPKDIPLGSLQHAWVFKMLNVQSF